MSLTASDIIDGVVLSGSQFSEPMRVIGIPTTGDGFVLVNLVGTRTNTFRGGVTLSNQDLASIQIERKEAVFQGKPRLFKLGLEAIRISLAQEYDPYFGLSISRVDPLPHQLDAVYNHLLKSARCRFLLADDAGAGKTIMAGLLLKELKLRGLVERVLIVCPANLAFQWQRELADRFQETFHILRGGDLRVQYGVNLWNDKPQIITSMDLAKRDEILPRVRQAEDWDLIIVDEAHRMSARDTEHKSERYRLGELLREKTAHFLLLTATPHKGDPTNFSLFLQLLDQEAYADVKSIHDAMDRREAACYLRRTKEVMLNFPKPQPDGTWKAVKLFKKRITHTVAFSLEGPEMELYQAVTHYVQRQSTRAAESGDERRARAVGFIMAMYQRRMASSTHSLKQSPIHRYGQTKDCLIFNFFAQNTVEGRVLQKLVEKLQEIRDALDDDAVFNVVGEVLPSNQIERLLRDFYAGKLSANDLEARLEVEVREEDFRRICQSALEGLAKKNLNLPMLVERRALAQERRIVPETVARFFDASAKEVGLSLTPLKATERAFTVGKIPIVLYEQARAKDWRLLQLAKSYDRIALTAAPWKPMSDSNGSRRGTRCSRPSAARCGTRRSRSSARARCSTNWNVSNPRCWSWSSPVWRTGWECPPPSPVPGGDQCRWHPPPARSELPARSDHPGAATQAVADLGVGRPAHANLPVRESPATVSG